MDDDIPVLKASVKMNLFCRRVVVFGRYDISLSLTDLVSLYLDRNLETLNRATRETFKLPHVYINSNNSIFFPACDTNADISVHEQYLRSIFRLFYSAQFCYS